MPRLFLVLLLSLSSLKVTPLFAYIPLQFCLFVGVFEVGTSTPYHSKKGHEKCRGALRKGKFYSKGEQHIMVFVPV